MEQTVRLSIPAEAGYLDIVRLTLYGIASKSGFSYEQIEDMKVAVGEACNNAILHGYGERDGFIHLSFERTGEGLTIRIKDEGRSFPHRADPAFGHAMREYAGSVHELTIGGLGLYLMQALMDRVDILTAEGTEVILTKLLSRKEEMA